DMELGLYQLAWIIADDHQSFCLPGQIQSYELSGMIVLVGVHPLGLDLADDDAGGQQTERQKQENKQLGTQPAPVTPGRKCHQSEAAQHNAERRVRHESAQVRV